MKLYHTVIFILLACIANVAAASGSSMGQITPLNAMNQQVSNPVFFKSSVAEKVGKNTSACPTSILCPSCTLKEPGITTASTEDSVAETSFFDDVWQRLVLMLGVL